MRSSTLLTMAVLVLGCARAPRDPALLPGGPPPGWGPRTTGPLPALAPPREPAPASAEVQFEVRTDRPLRLISPDIYGVNSWDPQQAIDFRARPASLRHGGNRLSAFNWENNASNAGRDYMNQNDGLLASSAAPGAALEAVLVRARTLGAGVVLTVPIGGHVAADVSPGGDVRASGADYLERRFRQNRARREPGPARINPDSRDPHVSQDEMVAWVRARYPTAPIAFSLDNEPDLWASSHPAIHPKPVGYDELCARNVEFARAIKDTWPEAAVLGFVSYGWNGYMTLQSAPDRGDKGVFVDYYLRQMKAAEAQHGRRLIDHLDLHWYPEARGGGARITLNRSANTEALIAARLQAPRSLWDPTYTEESWITSASTKGPIALIPRMRAKIDEHYPGTKLALTEWNYGGGDHISGALATADVLGIFGREGVDMAHLWLLEGAEPFTMAGLRLYRNYDGSGATFGDVSVPATTSDVEGTSVYASLFAGAPNKVIVVAINKRPTPVRAALRLAHPAAFTNAAVYAVTSARTEPRPGPALAASGENVFLYDMPPLSASVLVAKPD